MDPSVVEEIKVDVLHKKTIRIPDEQRMFSSVLIVLTEQTTHSSEQRKRASWINLEKSNPHQSYLHEKIIKASTLKVLKC